MLLEYIILYLMYHTLQYLRTSWIVFQAEDVLGCSHVVVCLGKPNSMKTSNNTYNNENINTQNFTTNLEYEKESKMAIRNFLFLGFQPLAPGHEFNPSNPNLVRYAVIDITPVFICTLLKY